MIRTDPDSLKQLKELADRNIANGDWGDEVSFPGDEVPLTLEERKTKSVVKHILSYRGGLRLPKRKK
jgi:hypothetical protein